jgi:hypothetical protein
LRNYGAAADGGLQEVDEGRRRHTTYEKERHYIDNYAEQTRKKNIIAYCNQLFQHKNNLK